MNLRLVLFAAFLTLAFGCTEDFDSNGRLSGKVTSAGTGTAVGNARVIISDVMIESLTDASGRFAIDEVPEGRFTVSASAEQFLTRYVPDIEIYRDETTRIDIVLPRLGITGSATGQVRDATTGEPVKGATVTYKGGSRTATTDADGNYTLNGVPEGPQYIVADADGYFPISSPATEIVEDQTSEIDFLLSPGFQNGETLRIVLSWGEFPHDLDSHIKTPDIGGSVYHVYYAEKGTAETLPYVELDIDDVTSYGPETITIYQAYPGTYYYYVHNYTQWADGVDALPSDHFTISEAVVQVYDEDGARERFTGDTGNGQSCEDHSKNNGFFSTNKTGEFLLGNHPPCRDWRGNQCGCAGRCPADQPACDTTDYRQPAQQPVADLVQD